MLQDPQVLGNDHNKPHSLMSDPISTMYFHNMFCDLLNKILFKPKLRALSVSKLFDTLMAFLKYFLEKIIKKKISITIQQQKHEKVSSMQTAKYLR